MPYCFFMSKDEESHFYVRMISDLNTFVVTYNGYLVPPNKEDMEPPETLKELFK